MKLQRIFKKIMGGASLGIVSCAAFPMTSDTSIGTVASNLTDATDAFSGIFKAIFYVIGIALVVASIMRYRDYRQNPSQTPISRVIVLLIAGVVIGCFPFIVNFMSNATSHLSV